MLTRNYQHVSWRLRVNVADGDAYVRPDEADRPVLPRQSFGKTNTLLLTFFGSLVLILVMFYGSAPRRPDGVAPVSGAVTESLIRSISAPTARSLASICLIATIDVVDAINDCLTLCHQAGENEGGRGAKIRSLNRSTRSKMWDHQQWRSAHSGEYCAPIRCNSEACIKRFSKTVSVITERPSDWVIRAMY